MEQADTDDRERKRFALKRYFSLTSLVCTVVIAVVLGWSYQHFSLRDLKSLAEGRNIALTHAFANALWSRFTGLVRDSAGAPADVLHARAKDAGLYDLVARYMKGTDVVKVKVYALNGVTVFSSDPSQTGESKSANPGFAAARDGGVASVLTRRDSMDSFEGTITNLDVISTYLPVRDEKSKVVGVIEIYSDVTVFVAQLTRTRILIGSVVFSLFALLYGLLYWLVARAQGIIDRQALQVDESLRAIEQANRDLDLRVQARTRALNESNRSLRNEIEVRRAAEEQLELAAAVFDNAMEGMLITDAKCMILRVNPAFTEITGYTAEEAVGRTPQLFKSGRHDADFYRAMWEAIARTGSWQGEIWDRRKNGEIYPKWLTITVVKGDNGAVTHYIGTQFDITKRKQAEERLNELAFFDQLTGLANRTLLLDRIRQAMNANSRTGTYSALLLIDLDKFKTLNDTLGHHMGDLLLKQVARRLTTCVRAVDTVARLGGDEFVIMLANLSLNESDAATQTEGVGEKILATLNRTYQLQDVAYHSTPSIGATLFRGHATDIDVLMRQADLAMYRSKDAGRNALRFFDPDMEIVVMKRAALEKDLHEAIEAKQFLLHYQPQLTGDRLTGAEALVRWRHPQRGMVSPAEFIPLAEETGMILPLGNWVLETACRQLALWAGRPEMAHLALAVNVSARQFRQADFVDQVLAVIEHTGANPQRLKLELTESLLVADVDEVIDKMSALKATGVSFALDDFGTGYSSLAYLSRLPLDQLKIDQSFVANIEASENDAVICAATISLAHSLKLKVVAEGVETEAQRYFLNVVHRCDLIQGYLISRPLPLDEFEAFSKAQMVRGLALLDGQS